VCELVYPSTICSYISIWAVREQNRLWHELSGCRQAKLFLHELDYSRARFALNLPRKDLRILVGLLTGLVDLNRHLHIMGLRQDSVCPLCQEEEDTTALFIAQCSAIMFFHPEEHSQRLHSFIRDVKQHPLVSPHKVCQSF